MTTDRREINKRYYEKRKNDPEVQAAARARAAARYERLQGNPSSLAKRRARAQENQAERRRRRGVHNAQWYSAPRNTREHRRKLCHWSRVEVARAMRAEHQRERMWAHDRWIEAILDQVDRAHGRV